MNDDDFLLLHVSVLRGPLVISTNLKIHFEQQLAIITKYMQSSLM